MTNRTRVVIADDHPVVVLGLETLFTVEGDIDVVARAADGSEVLEAVRTHQPDVLIVDRNMPAVDGLEVLRTLRAEESSVKAVLLGATLSEHDIERALRLGARGIVLKEHAPRELVQCVRTVAAGGWWLEHGRSATAVGTLLRGPDDTEDGELTPRERELTRLAVQGLRNKEIASLLGITEGTVKIHLNRIYRKLNVDSRVALVLRARDLSLDK